MSAPGRVELHQNVFRFIINHRGEGFSNQDIYVFGLGGWDFLRFKSGFQWTGFVIFEEFQNVFGSDWAFQSELLNIFVLESDDHAQWTIFTLDSNEFSQSLSKPIFDLSFRHDDFSFQRSRSSFEFFLGLFILGFVVSKQMEKGGFLILENDFGSFLVKSHYCGDGVGFHEFNEGFGWEISGIVVDFFVEGFEEGQFGGIQFGLKVGIERVQESHVVEFISSLEEVLVILVFFTNVNDNDSLGFEIFDLLSGLDEFWLSSYFFFEPVDNGLFSSSSSVFRLDPILEKD